MARQDHGDSGFMILSGHESVRLHFRVFRVFRGFNSDPINFQLSTRPSRRFDQRQLNRRAHIEDGGDGFVDGPGLEFLDGGEFGRVVFQVHHQHDGLEQDAQGADGEQDRRQPAVFAA